MAAKAKLNVHNFPRPPLLELTARHLVIQWGKEKVADTTSAYWALETTHPPSKSEEVAQANFHRDSLSLRLSA